MTALVPILTGNSVLDHAAFDRDLPVLGAVKTTTALIFDIGVYLVVIGLVLMSYEAFGDDVEPDEPPSHPTTPPPIRGPNCSRRPGHDRPHRVHGRRAVRLRHLAAHAAPAVAHHHRGRSARPRRQPPADRGRRPGRPGTADRDRGERPRSPTRSHRRWPSPPSSSRSASRRSCSRSGSGAGRSPATTRSKTTSRTTSSPASTGPRRPSATATATRSTSGSVRELARPAADRAAAARCRGLDHRWRSRCGSVPSPWSRSRQCS
jgi:hypothetical protein